MQGEEAIVNAMPAAEAMSGTLDGRDRDEVIPVDALLEILQRQGSLSTR